MKLGELLDLMNEFQEFQLVDFDTLDPLTRIDCLKNYGVRTAVQPYLNRMVCGIGSDMRHGVGDCYFRILLGREVNDG